MQKLVAIYEIEYLRAGKKAFAEPGSIFEADAETAERLKGMRAAREPNEAEMALYMLQNHQLVPAEKPAKADKAEAPKGEEPKGAESEEPKGEEKPAKAEKKSRVKSDDI